MLEGKLTLEQYRPEMLANAELLALIQRTSFEEVPEWTQRYYAAQAEREFRSSACVRLKDGRTADDERPFPHGHPKNPMSDAAIEKKFESLASSLASNPRDVLDRLWHLEEIDDVSELMALVSLNKEMMQ
jgi:2-methylcitrate dehydratase